MWPAQDNDKYGFLQRFEPQIFGIWFHLDALPLGFRKLTDERRCMLLPHKRPFMLIGSSKWQFYEMEHSWTKSVFIRQMFRTLKNPSPIRALVPLCVTPGFWNRRQLFSWVVSYLLDQSCFFHHENTFY